MLRSQYDALDAFRRVQAFLDPQATAPIGMEEEAYKGTASNIRAVEALPLDGSMPMPLDPHVAASVATAQSASAYALFHGERLQPVIGYIPSGAC